jgi:hypothetical protein
MNLKSYPERRDQGLNTAFEPNYKLHWVVRDDPGLEAELNGDSRDPKKVSQKVVDKVVDRIKSL